MKYFLYCRKSTESEDRQIMSLGSQRAELERAFGTDTNIQVVQVFEESKSAKSPGRPLFGQMIARIQAGEAQGILAWAPDRLARNSIDGGQLVYLLDQGVLIDLKFATYTFENNPQGKFMLSILFGQSKYFSDSLSENVKRGFRAKLERGWRPARAPVGYLTDPLTRQIAPHPIQFPLVRLMFQHVLSGRHSAKEVAVMAREEWGFVMPGNRQSKGGPISVAAVYRILANPFYAGVVLWGGQIYKGQHQAVVTPAEFEVVRQHIRAPETPKPKRHLFSFTGLIRCGACGLMITAEERVKPSGRRYTYYHCTKRALGPRCGQRSIRAEALERQVISFLASIAIPAEVEGSLLAALEDARSAELAQAEAQRASREGTLANLEAEGRELTQLRLKRLVSDEEFARERDRLGQERARLELAKGDAGPDRFELARTAISFSKCAISAFERGDALTKRLIVKITGSNPVMSDRILSIEAAKPFAWALKDTQIRERCGFRNDVRTLPTTQNIESWFLSLGRWVDEDPIEAIGLRTSLNAIWNP